MALFLLSCSIELGIQYLSLDFILELSTSRPLHTSAIYTVPTTSTSDNQHSHLLNYNCICSCIATKL